MSALDLPVVWFILVTVLFAGYFLLEGFDFGVGMLLPFAGRRKDAVSSDAARTGLVRTIGPVWDGNEVWLITAGGALFAAFPGWYAALFSGFYLPLFLILVALILRAVGLEWRGKVDTLTWRRRCDLTVTISSWMPPVLWGVAFANLVRGVPVDADQNMDSGLSTLIGLLNPYALLGAATVTCLFLLHGLSFLRLRTAGHLRDATTGLIVPVSVAAAVTGASFTVWTQLEYGKDWTWVVTVTAVVGVLTAVVAMRRDRDGLAFLATAVAVVSATVLLFGSLYPWLMPTTLADGVGLDIRNASSADYTLTVMTWAALFLVPFVVAYQVWTYWVFRKRITASPVTTAGTGAEAGPNTATGVGTRP
ncbi:cytochrome d ubiquinol oxidase subunit II [Corynebacterium terpenotabidum]|uniref:Cytochrome D terminal oxidase polypeptide subunit n=1 Tax=Corynebacterium terpenotabidum Y-11 TaxID=1200352 RepID=S4XH32_9CORY|nr:cytochrome d ubiquinol oxidase subunit II [Corynebacterium terpenotabidum]AGP31904.1 cytochrome D terminal oxidase polypeptide subunit [Corynebacterium terpenotabidum Y-11]